MTGRQQLIYGVAAIALIVVYSVIMVATSGGAASWAWVILLVAFGLLAVVARTASATRSRRRDG